MRKGMAGPGRLQHEVLRHGELVGAFALADAVNAPPCECGTGRPQSPTARTWKQGVPGSYYLLDVEGEVPCLEIAAELPWASHSAVEVWPVLHVTDRAGRTSGRPVTSPSDESPSDDEPLNDKLLRDEPSDDGADRRGPPAGARKVDRRQAVLRRIDPAAPPHRSLSAPAWTRNPSDRNGIRLGRVGAADVDQQALSGCRAGT